MIIGKDTNAINNELILHTIIANQNCLSLNSDGKNCYSNRITFNYFKAGGDGCYCIVNYGDNNYKQNLPGTLSENTFNGGQCLNADWAVYHTGENDKYNGIHIENKIKGGFVISNGCAIYYPRWAESARDGEYPFYKFDYGMEYGTDFISSVSYAGIYQNGIQLSDIDASDNVEQYKKEDGSTHYIVNSSISAIYGIVRSPGQLGANEATPVLTYDGVLIFGKHILIRPSMERTEEVTGNLDLTVIPQDSKCLPTKFDIKANSDIVLHPSYCAIAYKDFEVSTNGFNCRIYTWNNKLIFDSSNYESGTYKITSSFADKYIRYDGYGEEWNVKRLDVASSGGGNQYVKIGDFTVETASQTVAKSFDKTYKKAFAEIKFAPGTQNSRVYFAFTNTIWSGNIPATDAISTTERYMTVTGESFGDNKIFLNYTAPKALNELGYTMALSNPKAHNINGFTMYCDNGDKLIPAGTTFTVYGIE